MYKKTITILTAALAPYSALAQFDASRADVLFESMHDVISGRIIPLFVALALVYTIYSVVQFIAAADDSQQREEKKQQIFWGLIGLFVITSIWGLIAIIGDSFGLFAGGTLTNE